MRFDPNLIAFRPLPPGIAIGAGTPRPFGFTAGQIMEILVKTKSYAVATSVISGNTVDRSLGAFPFTNIYDKLAFVYNGTYLSDDSINDGMGNEVQIVIGGTGGAAEPIYYFGGKLYMAFAVGIGDAAGNIIGTNDGGMGLAGGLCSVWGVTTPFYKEQGTLSSGATIGPNTKF